MVAKAAVTESYRPVSAHLCPPLAAREKHLVPTRLPKTCYDCSLNGLVYKHTPVKLESMAQTRNWGFLPFKIKGKAFTLKANLLYFWFAVHFSKFSCLSVSSWQVFAGSSVASFGAAPSLPTSQRINVLPNGLSRQPQVAILGTAVFALASFSRHRGCCLTKPPFLCIYLIASTFVFH